MTKSYIPITNAQIKMNVYVGQSNKCQPRMKCDRPTEFKDKSPQIRRKLRIKIA